MVDPIFTYVGGIGALVLLIGTMLYLMYATEDVEEGDEHPGESVVGGAGPAAEQAREANAAKSAAGGDTESADDETESADDETESADGVEGAESVDEAADDETADGEGADDEDTEDEDPDDGSEADDATDESADVEADEEA